MLASGISKGLATLAQYDYVGHDARGRLCRVLEADQLVPSDTKAGTGRIREAERGDPIVDYYDGLGRLIVNGLRVDAECQPGPAEF